MTAAFDASPPAPATKPPRLLVPDVARGLALLGIAMANVSTAWIVGDDAGAIGSTVGGVDPDSVVDVVSAMFSAMFVHVRGLPMFSTLLGFGVGLLANSLYRKAYPLAKARGALLKRYGILGLIGIVHMLLLFKGDIMFSYGLAGMALALFMSVSTKVLRVLSYIFLGSSVFFGLTLAAGAAFVTDMPDGFTPTEFLTTPGEYFTANFLEGLVAFLGAFSAVPYLFGVMLTGFIWAREGVLADVDAHRKTLVTWAGITIGVIVLIGIPWGLATIGVFGETAEHVLEALNMGAGVLTGPGTLAIAALLLNGAQKRSVAGATPAVLYPFIALGKRSMSSYVAQSFLFIPVVMPFGLGLGLHSTVSVKLLIAFGIWLITLVLATVLEATGTPGPFEWVHRRLAYGRTGRLEPFQAPPQPRGQLYNGMHG